MPHLVFGGSFNPFGSHHLNILLQVRRDHPDDQILVVPSFSHPLKHPSSFAPFEHRLRMAEIALMDLGPTVRVSDAERMMGKPKSLTYDLLCFLRDTYKGEYKFVVGGDLRHEVPRWERVEDVEREFGFVWAGEVQGDYVHMTQVRQWIQEGDHRWSRYVPRRVADYIRRHHLYGYQEASRVLGYR